MNDDASRTGYAEAKLRRELQKLIVDGCKPHRLR